MRRGVGRSVLLFRYFDTPVRFFRVGFWDLFLFFFRSKTVDFLGRGVFLPEVLDRDLAVVRAGLVANLCSDLLRIMTSDLISSLGFFFTFFRELTLLFLIDIIRIFDFFCVEKSMDLIRGVSPNFIFFRLDFATDRPDFPSTFFFRGIRLGLGFDDLSLAGVTPERDIDRDTDSTLL